MRNLARHVQKSARLTRQVRRKVDADMELVDHEVLKLRGDESGLVPGKIGLSNDAVAGERRLQLPRVRIAFGAFAAVANYIEQIAVAIPYAADEALPMALLVFGKQAGIVALCDR